MNGASLTALSPHTEQPTQIVLLDEVTHSNLIITQIKLSAKAGKKMPLVEIINYLCADWQKNNK
jgi:hypothetical protein